MRRRLVCFFSHYFPSSVELFDLWLRWKGFFHNKKMLTDIDMHIGIFVGGNDKVFFRFITAKFRIMQCCKFSKYDELNQPVVKVILCHLAICFHLCLWTWRGLVGTINSSLIARPPFILWLLINHLGFIELTRVSYDEKMLLAACKPPYRSE